MRQDTVAADDDTAMLDGPPHLSAFYDDTRFMAVNDIMEGRCAMCHAAEPLWDGIAIAPKGVLLETPLQILCRSESNLSAIRGIPFYATCKHSLYGT